MNGKIYTLEKNSGEHNLHSGSDGFSYRLWEEKSLTANSVTFKLNSPDGDQGYPNAVNVELTYIVNDSKICIVHSARAEEKVFLNMNNLSSFFRYFSILICQDASDLPPSPFHFHACNSEKPVV